jgi:transitional endoplasmic reticulum ATPase
MDTLLNTELTLFTLLGVSLIPFAFFVVQQAYRTRGDLVRMWGLIILSVSVIIGSFILFRFAQHPGKTTEENVLYVLHLIPCFLSFLISGSPAMIASFSNSRGKDGKGGVKNWAPIPIKKGIEPVTWDDVILDNDTKSELAVIVELLRDPRASERYGIETPKGVLLSGPPGTGKTTIAKVIANSAGLSFFVLRTDEIVSKWVGESEKNLTALFHAAQRHAPSLIFIDEVDSIGGQRGGDQSWKDNLLNHMLQLIDGVVKSQGVHVVAATNRPDLVDGALKRSGRLNRTIEIPLPNYDARKALFSLYLSKLTLEQAVDIHQLAEITEGKSGADVKAICNQAGLNAFRRESGNGKGKREYKVTHQDLQIALENFIVNLNQNVKRDPTDQHGNYLAAPITEGIETLGWGNLIISEDVKTELIMLMELLKNPSAAQEYGIEVPKGILLSGPPGTGKTTIAKILAHTAGLSFFTLRADDIVSKWVGESEKNLTQLFNTAMKFAPALIFIDEVDSIGGSRGGSHKHSDNLLNHLLQMIDGVVKSEGLHIVAATNRPDLVDSALKRGGRLNRTIHIPLPDHNARKKLFQLFLSSLKLEEELNVDLLAKLTNGKSGADIQAICNQAGLNAFRRETLAGSRNFLVQQNDMKQALKAFLGGEQLAQ